MSDLFKMYTVGGAVRDEILGLKSKDIDYVAVPNENLLKTVNKAEDMFQLLIDYLTEDKFEIFLITKDCFTIRAKFPPEHKHSGVADFVMARKEVGYIPGTRQPIIQPGTLFDDLQRRDFTLNAMAKDENGEIIDYFDGLKDLMTRTLRTPLPPEVTFEDDPLRILRAIRFAITKGFKMKMDIDTKIHSFDYRTKMGVVSTERIREELFKCFKHDTLLTLKYLNNYKDLSAYIFNRIDGKLWLKPTNEQ